MHKIPFKAYFVLWFVTLLIFGCVDDRPNPEAIKAFYGQVCSDTQPELNYQKFLEAAKDAENKGDFERALICYESAIKVDRKCLPSYYPMFQKGQALITLGRTVEGKSALREYLAFAKAETSSRGKPYFFIISTATERTVELRKKMRAVEGILSRK
ncbi:MAG: hypothetical protein A2X80_07745 [Geobacteraceae bacterium GWB2_52_12]|nr:MAG: hypothetical protein A2X80_07745 [Geobacteraceae bacterium GWB2_52_12]